MEHLYNHLANRSNYERCRIIFLYIITHSDMHVYEITVDVHTQVCTYIHHVEEIWFDMHQDFFFLHTLCKLPYM